MTDWQQVRMALFLRSGGRCEFCTRSLNNRAHVHHRKLRSQGGGDEEENLVVIHPECHEFAHRNRAFAADHGWIVSGWSDPSQVPVTTCRTNMTACSHRE